METPLIKLGRNAEFHINGYRFRGLDSFKMLTLTQLVVACLLSTIILGAPSVTKGNISGSLSDGAALPPIISDRISGGLAAQPGQFPYVVSVRSWVSYRWEGGAGSHRCGGSIIAKRFVITAAFCYRQIYSMNPKGCGVLVGALERDPVKYTLYEVEKWIRHEKYYRSVYVVRSDIALIKTKRPIEYNEFVAPIALHSRFFDDGIDAVTLGYGNSKVRMIDSIEMDHQF